MAEQRQPLSFWGTVGAVVTAGVVTTAVSFGFTVLVVGIASRRAAQEALEGAGIQPQLPQGGGGGGPVFGPGSFQ